MSIWENENLPHWLQTFMEYTRPLPTGNILRFWSGLSCIAGALERRTWLLSAGRPLYPNLFIVFVTPPGVGKTVAIDETIRLWRATGKLNVAPRALPGKGMLEQLADQEHSRKEMRIGGKLHVYHAMLIAAPELGTLIPEYSLEFLSQLNDIFDCGDEFSERTRHGGWIQIENPHVSLLGGTQPNYLSALLPEAAFGMGFTSRMLMIYCGETPKIDIFGESSKRNDKLESPLLDWLVKLTSLHGPFEVEEDAREAIQSWYSKGMPPTPSHSKLAHYVTRRAAHLLKLTMAFSAARTTDMVITKTDFLLAKQALLEAEETMPEIFKEMTSHSQSSEIEEAYNYVFQTWLQNNRKAVREHKLVHFLHTRVPAREINSIVETMLSAGMIRNVMEGVKGTKERAFMPGTAVKTVGE